jgi:hypothetical protein
LIALRGNADGKFEAKSAVLFSGSTGEPIWTFQTETNHEIQRVRAGGDVNGDGIPDALVSCSWFVLILSGKDGSVIRRLEPAAQQYPHTFPFESLDSEHFGSAVAVLESHGLDWRVAIGAEETAAATGAVYLIDLKTEARPLFFPSDDDGPFYQLGSNLDRAGDVDGDGMDDVLCGTFAFFGEDEGLALVLSGKDGKELRRFVRRGDEVIALGIGEMAPRPGDSPSKPASPPEDSAKPLHPTFGCLVSEVGDADGDGTPDLLVADSGFSHSHVWLVSLAKRRALYSVPELSWGMETQRILPLGDVDGDGHPDWLQACCCTARIFSGIDGRLIREITEQLPGQVDDSSFSAIGDLDHDGHADVLIGTNRVSEGGRESGLASVRSGLDGHVLITVGDHEPRGWLEIAVGGTGDVDLDGTPDIGVVCGEYPEPKLSLVVFSGRTGAVLRRVRDLPTDGRIRFRPCGDLDGDGRLDCLIGTRGLVEVLSDYSDVTSLVLTARGLEYDAENADTEFARGLAGLSGRRSSHLDPSIAVSAPASPASGGSIHFCSAIDGAERAQFTEFGYESARKSGDYVIPDSVKWPTYPYRLGCSLADLGDVNGDGYDDVICGTENWYAHGEDGQAFVLDGSSGKLLYELRQSGDNVLVLAVGRDH